MYQHHLASRTILHARDHTWLQVSDLLVAWLSHPEFDSPRRPLEVANNTNYIYACS